MVRKGVGSEDAEMRCGCFLEVVVTETTTKSKSAIEERSSTVSSKKNEGANRK